MRAFVTGSSRGIGQAIAVRLAQDGFDVVVHYHQDTDGAEATANMVRDTGREALVLQADLGGAEAAWACAEAAGRGGLDAFVANAGLYDRRGFEDMTGDAWRRTMAVDLDAPALMTQALLPHLTTDARIVFISSVVAVRGSTHGAHYSTAKAGLLGLTRSLALELAPRRVNAVLPGYIDTDMIDDTPSDGCNGRWRCRWAAWATPQTSPAPCRGSSVPTAPTSPGRPSRSTEACGSDGPQP